MLNEQPVTHQSNEVTAEHRMCSWPELKGEHYKLVLKRFHEALKPNTYLEIGVSDGATLGLAQCNAIAIDPDFRLKDFQPNKKSSCGLYSMTSDAFFNRYDPSQIFGDKIDMAFLDGMHWFEFLLRDFINVERFCKPNSIIFMHDCIPRDEHVARRQANDSKFSSQSAYPSWWAGDVWKVADMLLTYRTDLAIHALDAAPTGLIAITGLNPKSTILSERYFELLQKYRTIDIAAKGDDFFVKLNIIETRRYDTFERISSAFWL